MGEGGLNGLLKGYFIYCYRYTMQAQTQSYSAIVPRDEQRLLVIIDDMIPSTGVDGRGTNTTAGSGCSPVRQDKVNR